MATTTADPGFIVGVGVGVGVGAGVGVGVGLSAGVEADPAAATAVVAVECGSSPAVVGLEAHAAQIATANRMATTPTRAWLGQRRPCRRNLIYGMILIQP